MQTIQAPQLDYNRGLREYVEKACRGRAKAELASYILQNRTTVNLVKHLRRHTTGSPDTLATYAIAIRKYTLWLQRSPDQILFDCYGPDGEPLPKMLVKHAELIDDFVGHLQDQRLSPGSIITYKAGVKALYEANRFRLQLPRDKRLIQHPNRSPTPEELERVLGVADLRERLIVLMAALGGFRLGTLSKLTYRHVRDDLDRGIVPVMVRVEGIISKGQYLPDYYTYLAGEVVEALKAYLEARRKGTQYVPPETIDDDSPLIRDSRTSIVKPVEPEALWRIIHNLYKKSGLVRVNKNTQSSLSPRYDLRPHSLRYYFRTQLTALGVNSEYAEFMMGHKRSSYNDIKMKGPEFLRSIYAASGLSIRQKTKASREDLVKEVLRSFGLDPEKILVAGALAEPHRTVATPGDGSGQNLDLLRRALKDAVVEMSRQSQTVNPTAPLP